MRMPSLPSDGGIRMSVTTTSGCQRLDRLLELRSSRAHRRQFDLRRLAEQRGQELPDHVGILGHDDPEPSSRRLAAVGDRWLLF